MKKPKQIHQLRVSKGSWLPKFKEKKKKKRYHILENHLREYQVKNYCFKYKIYKVWMSVLPFQLLTEAYSFCICILLALWNRDLCQSNTTINKIPVDSGRNQHHSALFWSSSGLKLMTRAPPYEQVTRETFFSGLWNERTINRESLSFTLLMIP